MEKNLVKYWMFNHQMKWSQIERPYLDSMIDIGDFLEKQDYLPEPDLCVGDELNFISIFNHPFKEEYLFHIVVDNFSKILYANTLPAMFELFVQVNQVFNSYLRTCLMMDELKNDEFEG